MYMPALPPPGERAPRRCGPRLLCAGLFFCVDLGRCAERAPALSARSSAHTPRAIVAGALRLGVRGRPSSRVWPAMANAGPRAPPSRGAGGRAEQKSRVRGVGWPAVHSRCGGGAPSFTPLRRKRARPWAVAPAATAPVVRVIVYRACAPPPPTPGLSVLVPASPCVVWPAGCWWRPPWSAQLRCSPPPSWRTRP